MKTLTQLQLSFVFINSWIHFLVDCQRTPTISIISPKQTKHIGGTVELDCSVQNARPYPILWIKVEKANNHLTISSGSTLILRDSRFSLRYDPSSSLYALQIKDLQESDAGTYQCQILISVTNRVKSNVNLFVQIPPTISDNSTQQSVVVSEGQRVTLECYAFGYPQPRITWRRENYALLPTGGLIYRGNILKILSVKKTDRGIYYCVADNNVGKGAKRIISLEVEFAPEIEVPRPLVKQALGYDIDLECHIVAYPPPTITWLHKDVMLSSNRNHKITHFSATDEFTDTTLRVVTIKGRSFGEYYCKAANKLGIAERQIILVETDTPVCPPACSYYGSTRPIFAQTNIIYMTLLVPFVGYIFI